MSWLARLAMIARLKPVTWTEIASAANTSSAISGVRERGRVTVWPFSSVMSSGLKMRSNSGVLAPGATVFFMARPP